MNWLCVYGGTAAGNRPAFLSAAHGLGEALAFADIGLVYGGSAIGLEGGLANAVLGAGGQVVGVIPRALVERELAHPHLTRLIVTQTIHERKAKMMEMSDAFCALPGGFGTLEELTEVIAWQQLGLHKRPIALFDVEGYFDKFLTFVEHAVSEGFMRPEHRHQLFTVHTPQALIGRLFPPA
jgi:uncharacterized protein (TIGR00730 family)